MPIAFPKVDPVIGQVMLVVAAIFLISALWLWIRDHRPADRASIALPEEPVWPTDEDIRIECAENGWPRAEPYLTMAREQLEFRRHFDELTSDDKQSDSR